MPSALSSDCFRMLNIWFLFLCSSYHPPCVYQGRGGSPPPEPGYLCCPKPPCCVTIKVFAKMLPAVFELITNKSYAVEICPHGKLLIFNLWFLAGSAFLR